MAVCDLLPEKSKTYADQYNLRWFTNYHDMLIQMPEIDVVGVITPSGMHAEHALDVINTYRKHVIIEKPTFLRVEHVDQVFDAAARAGRRVYPIFQNRHNPAVQRLKAAILSGELGDLRIVSLRMRWCRLQRYYDLAPWRGTFSHDGGALSNQGIHYIDLLRYLGGEIDQVSAVLRTQGAEIEVEDSGVATLTFPSGSIGIVEITTAARPSDYEASLSIVGSLGLAQIGGLAANEVQIFTPDPQACLAFSQRIPDGYGFGHIDVYRTVAEDLQAVRPFPVDQADCRRTIQLLHAFYRSAETGSPVCVNASESSSRLGQADEPLSALYRSLPRCPLATG